MISLVLTKSSASRVGEGLSPHPRLSDRALVRRLRTEDPVEEKRVEPRPVVVVEANAEVWVDHSLPNYTRNE